MNINFTSQSYIQTSLGGREKKKGEFRIPFTKDSQMLTDGDQLKNSKKGMSRDCATFRSLGAHGAAHSRIKAMKQFT